MVEKKEGELDNEAKRIFWILTGHIPIVCCRWSLEWIYNYLSQMCIYSIYSLHLLMMSLECELL